MPSFEDLGLREELLRTVEDEDVERPTALQAAVVPALRRGTNVVARASTGSGKTLAYLLGVLDRLEPREAAGEGEVPLRVLVVTPTQEDAERVALAAFPYTQAIGAAVAVPGGSWGTPAAAAEVVVAPAAEAMAAVRASQLKLESLETVVVDGASTISELGDWEQLDAVLDLIPRDAQRVLISAAIPERVQDLADRRVKRALQYPAEAALADERTAPAEGRFNYVLVRAGEKLDVLVGQLATPEEAGLPPVIFCRTDERAAELAEQLAIRGFAVGAVDDVEADVAVVAADATREELAEESGGDLGQTISYDVPADAESLRARHAADPDAVVLVEPRQLPHLREIAALARLTPSAIAIPIDRGPTAARLNAFRDEIRRALRSEDLAAQMLILEPLFDEFSAPEVAAAAAALLRKRQPAAAEAAPPQPSRTTAPKAPSVRGAGATAGPAPATWARLYVGVGSRDDVRPGDLVGALAGEAEIPGAAIGKIEIRDTFSIVEVQSELADRVIQAVNGTTIKGRSARVDYDRGNERGRRGAAPARRQTGRPAGERRVVRRPPREPREPRE